MDAALRDMILKILAEHRILTLATVRPDGWPQATTVGYAVEGMTLYFLCGADSQKARNIAACDKVSFTIDDDADDMQNLKGVSIAARAEFVTEAKAQQEIFRRLVAKYPSAKDLPPPDPATVRYVRLTPKIVSVLDYSKGFGHTDQVEIAEPLNAPF